MNDANKELKKELVEQIKKIVILVISLLLILKGVSIAGFFKNITNEKIQWALDFGVFNALIGIIWAIFSYKIKSEKMSISVKITDFKNKSNVINLNKSNGKIKVELKIIGKAKKKNPVINIVFPSWTDIQLKDKEYLDIDYENSKIKIDISSLVKNKRNYDITEPITIDLISSADEKDSTDFSECYLEKEKFLIDFQKTEIKITNG